MVIDFDSDRLFGNPTYNIFSPVQRNIDSKDTKTLKKYCKARYQYLVEHNLDERLTNIKQQWDPSAAEALDQDFQRACSHASSICKKKPNISYVRVISQLRAKKNVLQKLLSGH